MGGISGYLNDALINNCYNCNELEVINPYSQFFIGGINGYADGGSINNCANIGNIIAKKDICRVGGIIGHNFNVNIEASCYISSSANDGVGITSPGSVSTVKISKVEDINKMPKILDIIGDAFEINNNVNLGYPILKWQ